MSQYVLVIRYCCIVVNSGKLSIAKGVEILPREMATTLGKISYASMASQKLQLDQVKRAHVRR
jgi:hypothetical protein